MNTFLLISFISGFALMVVELTASRILAPIMGSSVYTWTAVIGTVFLGMSIGNIIGGYIIDKRRVLKNLFLFFISTSLLIALIPILARNSTWIILSETTLQIKVIVVSFFIFLLPSISFGTIYPGLMTFYLESLDEAGKKTGSISAAWSLGGIIGTFLTGFFFVGYFGSTKTILFMSLAMFICGFLVYLPKNKPKLLTLLFIFLLTLQFSNSLPQTKNISNLEYFKESDYYSMKIADIEISPSNKARFLVLDFDFHSLEGETDTDTYPYIYPVFSLLNDEMRRITIIGGGSNLMSKKMADYYPKATVKNIEIDPAVGEVAEKYFKKSNNSIETVYADGRMFLKKETGDYDLIFVDAFNSFISTPWHMTTLEFNNLANSKLSENGIFGINIVSTLEGENSEVFQSIYKTLSETFPNIYVFAFEKNPETVQNIVLIGTKNEKAPDSESFLDKLDSNNETLRFSEKLVLNKPKITVRTPILTDDFAPTERLSSKMLRSYFNKHAAYYYKYF